MTDLTETRRGFLGTLGVALGGMAAVPAGAAQRPLEPLSAKADGLTDDTAAIQEALDEAAKTGGRVDLPPGHFLVKGSLRVPPGVTLQGVMESPVWSAPLKGSVILATGGRGQEDGPALFEMGSSSACAAWKSSMKSAIKPSSPITSRSENNHEESGWVASQPAMETATYTADAGQHAWSRRLGNGTHGAPKLKRHPKRRGRLNE